MPGPRRYLWTDAFAVCNFLDLFARTGDQDHRRSATDLVDQVHWVLGRYRDDDARSGWLSGLDAKTGRRRPTAGGLRIGKPLKERQAYDPVDQRLEWDRDGQYFHYLTKWMHALCQAAFATGDSVYARWAGELAQAAFDGFVRRSASGEVVGDGLGFATRPALRRTLDLLLPSQALSRDVVDAWLPQAEHPDESWQAHHDINDVMLARP